MKPTKGGVTRRDMLKTTGQAAAVGALARLTLPRAYAAEDNTIQLALVGCGGRGTGAIANALSREKGPTKLVAMADVFRDRLDTSFNSLQTNFPDQVDVSESQKFIGFEAYKLAIDCLNPGDIVAMATPPAFRWLQFKYAIEKGVNVFMEKPVTVDGPTTRKMLELADQADAKNIKVGVGLMCRHCKARQELFDRIQSGQIGDLVLLRAYRQHGPVGSAFSERKPDDVDELEFQIRRFHSFLWASGGCYSDFYIHNIDESCWMKNAWPVEARASGGRNYRGDYVDQNFDVYSVEYTFADGAKLILEGRTMIGADSKFASFAHGTKGSGVISIEGHHPAHCRTYSGQKFEKSAITCEYPDRDPYPCELESEPLFQAGRRNRPDTEARRGAEASLVTSMGRMAAHTGQVITYDQILNSDHEFAPDLENLVLGGPAPLQPDEDGKYPIPLPGIVKKREYDVLT